MGGLASPRGRDTLTGESPTHTTLSELWYCACLSPLQSERCTAAILHKPLIYRKQKLQNDLPMAMGSQDRSLGLCHWPKSLSLIRHSSKCPKCLLTHHHPHPDHPRARPSQTPGGLLAHPSHCPPSWLRSPVLSGPCLYSLCASGLRFPGR